MTAEVTLDPERFDAVIFDLDGVLTDTARVHAAAWKRTFDGFLASRAKETGEAQPPFDEEVDYQRHVDGKRRHDGVAAFLESRGISLPYGEPGDSVHKHTVCGLANRKNLDFRQQLAEHGVEVFRSSIALVEALPAAGIRVAVVSASRNCQAVLEAAGIRGLFEVRVDGRDAQELGLPGKPDPATFLEAAARLGVTPERTVLVEDAISGVEAGRRGGFGLVIGVDRGGALGRLKEHGADVEVPDLASVQVATSALPDALERFDAIAGRLGGRDPVLFLDYDGTLTPIVDDPDRAVLSEPMREALAALGRRICVGVITGRDLARIKELLGLDDLVYAASHGFDIEGSKARPMRHEQGAEFLDDLDSAEAALAEELPRIRGARMERKRFAITVHFREVAASDLERVERVVERVADDHPRLRVSPGKMIHELQPAIDWHKGKALLWLLERLGFGEEVPVVFIGDDVTDEDAFGVLDDRGVGIVVQERPQPSRATFRLRDPDAVRAFLLRLHDHLGEAA
jgi:trehalose 6-phosphate phosphatase